LSTRTRFEKDVKFKKQLGNGLLAYMVVALFFAATLCLAEADHGCNFWLSVWMLTVLSSWKAFYPS